MKITVIETGKSKMGAFAIIYGYRSWPERVLRHRGWWDAHIIYERPAHPDEEEEQVAAWRYLAYRYADWSALAGDEEKFGFDANRLKNQHLENLRKGNCVETADVVEV